MVKQIINQREQDLKDKHFNKMQFERNTQGKIIIEQEVDLFALETGNLSPEKQQSSSSAVKQHSRIMTFAGSKVSN
jgi:hypothetical protein